MPRKSISGFAEAGAAMAQQLDDNDLLNLFTAVGRVVSKRFLMKRLCLDQWQLVIDYLRSAMGFELREQFRVLYNDRLQQYSRQLGRPIGLDQARALGLDRLVISQVVSEIVLD